MEASLRCLRDAPYRVESGLPSAIGTAALAVVVVSSLGDHHAAAELAGAVTTGPYVPLLMLMSDPDQRDELDQAVTRLHGVLGDVSFDAAVARGAAMSHDEIVDLTLRASTMRSCS